jgi:hypothetical protein
MIGSMPGRLPAVLVAAVALAGPGSAAAPVYRWVDERGSAHYAEGIDSVPERYRSRATPLATGVRPAVAPVPATTPAGTSPASGSVTIPFTAGERIMVDARINGTTRSGSSWTPGRRGRSSARGPSWRPACR